MNRHRDDGMTMVELLVVVLIMGVISGALLTVFTTFLRAQTSAATPFDDSRSLQQLSAYMPRDIAASIPASLSADPLRASPCPGSGGGTNVIGMSWNEVFGNGVAATTYDASYRLQVISSKTWLVRVTCQGPTWSNTKVIKLTDRLASVNSPVTADVNGGYVIMTVQTNTGRQLKLAATSSSPTEGLDHDDELD